MSKQYTYLVKRKCDGELFVTFGDFKNPANRPSCLYSFAPEAYRYKVKTPFGNVYNVSNDLKYNSKTYSVVRQYLMAA